jgi:Big-like domain-containing protein
MPGIRAYSRSLCLASLLGAFSIVFHSTALVAARRPDTTPPTVSITAPSSGATVSGAITLTATASDNVRVASVQFKLDGANLGAKDTAAPYAVSWNTTTATSGPHTLVAVALDTSGNSTTSAAVTVTVAQSDTTPPVISAVAASAITSSGATIGWTTTEPADSQVEYGLTTSYGSTSELDTSLVTSHSIALSLSASTAYHFRVRSRDAGGNLALSGDSTLTTSAPADTTAPSVSLTAPAAGATVAASITVSATASDNIGVAGVQFKLDGVNLGGEKLAPPYSISWDTSTASNGSHSVSAVARDAAGNVASSAAVQVTVNNVASGGGVLFESNWDTATGTASSAVDDGGRWPNYWEFNNGTGVQLLSVVPGGPAGHNALRVQQRGPNYAANVQVNNFVTPATDFYVRYYMKNDDTSPEGDHVVTVDTWGYGNLTFMRKFSSAADWGFAISMYGCGYTYPIGHWKPASRLQHGQWYRFEYFVHYTDATHVQVHPRVYDASGALLFSDADFRQEDYATGQYWNGRDNWTLASYYAAGYSFCVDAAYMTNFGMGNNGNYGAVDTRLYWYFAALQIRNDQWPGPAGSSAPTVSITAPATGATVSGMTAVSATASAPAGVAGVQFKLDGTNLGTELTAPPYSGSWNTTTATDGSHTLTAIARDMAGVGSTSAGVTVTVSNAAPPPPPDGIAPLYPGDIGIENHPDVVFVERFDEATLTDLFSRWTDILNGSAMTFSTDVPTGSRGLHSLNIPWVGGGVNNGGHLYKLLSPGVSDTLYVRYYVKYPTVGHPQHEGAWIGGNNPPLTWPNPMAGVKPTGSDRFSAAAEQSDDLTHFDHYDYFSNMRAAPDGYYWGNTLLNNPNVKVAAGQWACVEHMVKLNNPVTAMNGEHAIWINGTKVSHVGLNFPNGRWNGGNFTQDPTGTPFEGLRWRTDSNLNINYIWLENYSPNDPAGVTSSIKYDHVVAAKSRIGCLAP